MRISVFLFWVLGLLVSGLSCEKASTPTPPDPDSDPKPVQSEPTLARQHPEAQVRLATPASVVAMRTLNQVQEHGTISGAFFKNQELPLLGVGLNRCQTGWVIQGFYPQDGAFSATHPMLIQLGSVPNKPFRYVVPEIPGHIELNFENFFEEALKGEFAIVKEDGSRHIVMKVDTSPMSVLSSPEAAEQGCFTTGYFGIGEGRMDRPVSAVFDGKNAHYISIRLTPNHSIALLMDLRAHQKGPQHVLRGDLSRAERNPAAVPFRVFFEIVDPVSPAEDEIGPNFAPRQIAAREGEITASFATNDVGGPLKVELKNLRFPKWDGPYSGETLPLVRAEMLFYTKGMKVVPIPAIK